jgi:hypothetical protein
VWRRRGRRTGDRDAAPAELAHETEGRPIVEHEDGGHFGRLLLEGRRDLATTGRIGSALERPSAESTGRAHGVEGLLHADHRAVTVEIGPLDLLEQGELPMTEGLQAVDGQLDHPLEVDVDVVETGGIARPTDERQRRPGREQTVDPLVVEPHLHEDDAVDEAV